MTYILNSVSSGQESNRLDFQHYWMKKFIRDRFPPPVLAHISSLQSPRIADIGTGTGVWLLELSEEFPSARLEGFDFDVTKFPPQQDLPANVSLSFGDILQPFPSEHLGAYDIVHVRFLMYALKIKDWDVAIRNAMELLKPGGWLFWEETGYQSWVTIPPSAAEAEILRYDMEFAASAGRDLTQPIILIHNFNKAGLLSCTDKDYHSFEVPKEDGGSSRVKLRVFTQAAHGIVKQGGMDGLRTTEDAEKLIKALEDDFFVKGIWSGFGVKWVWGKKPNL